MRISPTLTEMATYPFVRLEEERRRLEADGVPVIDFGKGDPNEPTDPRIRQALVENLTERSSYPLAQGLPELRAAVARWCERRFGVALDPDTEVVPTLGSKEAIFSLAQVLVDPPDKRLVVYTEPGYPVYERGALFAGAEPLALPLRAENDFLPDLDTVDEETWRRTAILWVNYPNNPTGATARLDFYQRAAELAARWDFALASDEAYTEIAALKAFRPTVGTAPQEFVQRASVVAWDDEEHVARARETYRRKREILLGALERRGFRVAGSRAGMYLWVEMAGELVPRLLEHGVVVSPGEFFGPSGAGYVRFALVPTEAECRRAAEILEEVL
ncbi:MAG: aminotransferase class I/II-fold pyridoxal phosphate-dependent enzyme [Actinobacteria bacterium]|nr:MAG: aminotransferase class I/II-fold pyridoxal phosphate-dependent enzyme [Actinomycetota bacterium]